MAWLRERINNRPLREGTRKGHLTTYKALERFGKFKTFDDVTLQHIYQFDLFIREEQTYMTKGKPIVRSQTASITITSVSSRLFSKRSALGLSRTILTDIA